MNERLSSGGIYTGGIRVTKLIMMETGTHNEQYRRPYSTSITGHTRNMILERLNGAENYTPQQLGTVAGGFITPTAQPEKKIDIIGGWNSRRMQFILEVERISQLGGGYKEVFMGYTDYDGVSQSLHIDPKMVFYINSTASVKQYLGSVGVGGRQFETSVLNNSHVLVSNDWNGIYTKERENRMRPEDVYAQMAVAELGNVIDPRDTYDDRAVLSAIPTFSDRANNSSATYMSRVLTGYTKAIRGSDINASSTSQFDSARGIMHEPLISHNSFMVAMQQVNGGRGHSFSYGDLLQIDPNADNIKVVILLDSRTRAQTHQAGQTANWGASDLETVSASILSNSVPSLMMELTMSKMAFMATNRNFGAEVTVMLGDARSFVSADLSAYMDIFVTRLKTEILPIISYNNEIDFELEMVIDLLGETWLKLSMNGQPSVDYVTPSFCDALMVPIVTNNPMLATNIATDFNLLGDTLVENYSSSRLGTGNGGGFRASSQRSIQAI